jgi:hypothetical protein
VAPTQETLTHLVDLVVTAQLVNLGTVTRVCSSNCQLAFWRHYTWHRHVTAQVARPTAPVTIRAQSSALGSYFGSIGTYGTVINDFTNIWLVGQSAILVARPLAPARGLFGNDSQLRSLVDMAPGSGPIPHKLQGQRHMSPRLDHWHRSLTQAWLPFAGGINVKPCCEWQGFSNILTWML